MPLFVPTDTPLSSLTMISKHRFILSGMLDSSHYLGVKWGLEMESQHVPDGSFIIHDNSLEWENIKEHELASYLKAVIWNFPYLFSRIGRQMGCFHVSLDMKISIPLVVHASSYHEKFFLWCLPNKGWSWRRRGEKEHVPSIWRSYLLSSVYCIHLVHRNGFIYSKNHLVTDLEGDSIYWVRRGCPNLAANPLFWMRLEKGGLIAQFYHFS